ncbi:hypothetical protein K0U27_00625 [archaeon]|nr:hypothetical protein [archaeon]
MKKYCYECHKDILFFTRKFRFKDIDSLKYELPRGMSKDDILCSVCCSRRTKTKEYRYRKPVNIKNQTLFVIGIFAIVGISSIIGSFGPVASFMIFLFVALPLSYIMIIPFHKIRRKRDLLMYNSLLTIPLGIAATLDGLFIFVSLIGIIVFFGFIVWLLRFWSKKWNASIPKRDPSTLSSPILKKQNKLKIIAEGLFSILIINGVNNFLFGKEIDSFRYPDRSYPIYFQNEIQFYSTVVIAILILTPIIWLFIKRFDKEWKYNFPDIN